MVKRRRFIGLGLFRPRNVIAIVFSKKCKHSSKLIIDCTLAELAVTVRELTESYVRFYNEATDQEKECVELALSARIVKR